MYQQNAQYSEMSQQQTTNAKIQTQGGVGSSVGYDVMDSKFKAAGQMGSVEGTQKAFSDAGKELIEGIKQVTKELTENAKKGEIGTSKGIAHEKSIHGGANSNIAMDLAQSGTESQMESGFAAIKTMGGGQKGIHSLAKQAGALTTIQTSISSKMLGKFGVGGMVKAGFASQAASTQGTLNSTDALGGTENYIDTMAYGAEKQAIGANEQMKEDENLNLAKDGRVSALGVKAAKNTAAINAAKSSEAASFEKKVKANYDGILASAESSGHLATTKASMVKEGKIKEDGTLGDKAIAQYMISSESTMEQRELQTADGKNGTLRTYKSRTIGALNEKTGEVDYQSDVKLADSSNQTKDGSFWDGQFRDMAPDGLVRAWDAGKEVAGGLATVGGLVAGGQMLKNYLKKPNGSLSQPNTTNASTPNTPTTSGQLDKNHSIMDSSLNDIDDVNRNIEKNQGEFKATSSKMKSLEKAEQGLQSSISKQEANLKALKDSGAPATRITEAEEKLAQTVEKHDGIKSSLSETREKIGSLANEFDNLQGSKIDAEKAFLNTEAPKSNPTMMQRASEAFGDNFAKGFTVDNLKAVGKASLPAVAIEAGAQGMQYVANNTTGNTQKVAQVGVDAMNSDTAQYAATGGMIGAAIGGVAGFFGGFGVGALPGMAAGATIGTNLGASVGLLKDSLDGSLQAGNQNIKNGFNGLMNMASDFGSSISSSVSQGVQSATNQVSNIDVAKSFDNFMNNMGLGNSSVSSVTASALSQPSNFQGVNMMNSSSMPQFLQNNDPAKGGILDPTSTLNGMINLANTGNQQLANQQIQGEVNQVGNQIDVVKNFLDKMVKNPQDNEFLKIKSSLNKTN